MLIAPAQPLAPPSAPAMSAPTEAAALPTPVPIDDTPSQPTSTVPVVDGASWKLYDETTATGAIVEAIDGARSVVNAEFFGISDAGKGAQVTASLARAAKRGVEVNVIADFLSQAALPLGSFQRFKHTITDAGGDVVVTSRMPGSPRKRETPALAHVDHRKVVTVDGEKGFVGGMNLLKLTDDYHDSMVGLTGKGARDLAADQLDRWTRVGGSVSDRHAGSIGPEQPSSPTDINIVKNAPEQHHFELTDSYRDLIRSAKERVWVASPGISDRSIVADLTAAAARGVDVRMVGPGAAPLGVPFVNWVAQAHMAGVTAAGGTAYTIPEVLHRKALIVDDEAVLSSYNLTKRSAVHDHEIGVRTTDPEFVAAVADVFENDIQRSTKITPGKPTIGTRIGGFIAERFDY